MSGHILITGSEGLVGSALRAFLEAHGREVAGLDLSAKGSGNGDIRDSGRVRDAVAGCCGVVHLAAVSRVLWGERAPDDCFAVNAGGLRNVLEAAGSEAAEPWVLFASSREVYGRPRRLPATEETPFRPVNAYGRSKVEGERLVREAQHRGLRAATVRLSNVYGSVRDHPDRVVPAFARAAATGRTIRMDGADCAFDFTHIDDTVRGMAALIDRLEAGGTPPPVHLVTGVPTALRELAALAMELAGRSVPLAEAPPRPFDAPRFHGDPSRAMEMLGWEPRIALRDGLARLIHDFRTRADEAEYAGAAS